MLALPLLPFLPPGLSPLPFPAPLPWLLLLLALLALAAAAYLPFKSLASSLLAPHRAAVLPTSTPANGHTTALFPPPPLRGRGRGRTKPLGRFASLGLGLGFGRRAKSLGPVLPRFALPLDEQRSVHGHGHPYAHPYVPSAPPTPSPRLPEFAGAVPLVDLSDSHSHLHYAERGAEGLAGAVERDSWGTLSSLSSGSAPTSTRPSVSERGNRHAQLVDVSPSSEEADLVDVSVPPSPAAWARAHPISPRAMAFPEPMRPVPASPNVNPLPALPLPPALNAPLLLPRADINTTEAMNTHTPALAPAAAAVFATVAEPAHEYGYEEEMQMQEQTQTQLPSPPLSPPPLFSASASTSASASASASTSAAPRKDGYAAEAEVEASTRAFGGAVVHPASDSDSESDSDHEVEAAPPAPAPAYPLPVSGPTRLVVSPPPPTGEAQEGDEEQVEEQAEENTVGDEEEDEEELPSPRAIDAVVRGMHVAPPGYVSDADADAGSGADDDGEREEGDGAPAYAYAVEDGSVEAQDGGAEVEAPMEVEVERGVEAVATGGEGVLLAPVAALADDHVHAYEDVDVDAHAGDGDAERGPDGREQAQESEREEGECDLISWDAPPSPSHPSSLPPLDGEYELHRTEDDGYDLPDHDHDDKDDDNDNDTNEYNHDYEHEHAQHLDLDLVRAAHEGEGEGEAQHGDEHEEGEGEDEEAKDGADTDPAELALPAMPLPSLLSSHLSSPGTPLPLTGTPLPLLLNVNVSDVRTDTSSSPSPSPSPSPTQAEDEEESGAEADVEDADADAEAGADGYGYEDDPDPGELALPAMPLPLPLPSSMPLPWTAATASAPMAFTPPADDVDVEPLLLDFAGPGTPVLVPGLRVETYGVGVGDSATQDVGEHDIASPVTATTGSRSTSTTSNSPAERARLLPPYSHSAARRPRSRTEGRPPASAPSAHEEGEEATADGEEEVEDADDADDDNGEEEEEVDLSAGMVALRRPPAWSRRAAAAPALGLPSSALLAPQEAWVVPGAFPGAGPASPPTSPPAGHAQAGSAAPTTATSTSTAVERTNSNASGKLKQRRSPLDAALAMQLRPGMGAGADGAWLVRFLMSFFGWFAVLVAGGREFS